MRRGLWVLRVPRKRCTYSYQDLRVGHLWRDKWTALSRPMKRPKWTTLRTLPVLYSHFPVQNALRCKASGASAAEKGDLKCFRGLKCVRKKNEMFQGLSPESQNQVMALTFICRVCLTAVELSVGPLSFSLSLFRSPPRARSLSLYHTLSISLSLSHSLCRSVVKVPSVRRG